MKQELKKITGSRRELRNFGIVMGVVGAGIGLLLFYKDYSASTFFFIASSLFTILGFLLPMVLRPLYWPWMVFAVILGWVMTRIILTLLFITIITPIGIITRVLGKLSINPKFREDQQTYWCTIDKKEHEQRDCEKQY